MSKYDYLIVGAGLFGATFAHRAHQKGKKCIVLEKRPHLGGCCYCENIEGINVHKYGAHIFHTNNKKVWDFVNTFVSFNRYTNSPIANYKGRLFNLPFNMNTFYQMWGVTTPEQAKIKIEEQKQEMEGRIPANLEEQAIALVGRDIYEVLIKGYTEKQWGRKCTDLPAFIIRRIPLRFTFDNNYFNARYQGIPIGGFNKLIEGLLRNVETKTSTNFFENRGYWMSIANKIVYSGQLDEFFDFKLGKLHWRTVRFEEEILNMSNFQGNAVINYTAKDIPFTRVIEHKHFESFGDDVYQKLKTVISREYPAEYKEGMEPYYTVNDNRNNSLSREYMILAEKEENVIFGGRLAEYRYYDMDQVIEKAMKVTIT